MACEIVCRRCDEECAKHANQHEHRRNYAEACMRCAEACREGMSDLH